MPEKILVVDDDPVNLKMAASVLAKEGFAVLTAENGLLALSAVQDSKPDLIVLDVMMPELNGYEAATKLRKDPETANIPIILLTALDSIEEKIKGFEAGADDYMAKPFQPEELVARIQVQLKHAQRQKVSSKVSRNGKVIGVYSLRGGTGVSSIATNLAVGLCQLWGEESVLVDMAMVAGQSALMLNLPLRNTWADIAETPAEEIDGELVSKLLRPHPSGVQVLAAPSRPEQSELLQPASIRRVLELLRDSHEYIVLDLPHDLSETTLTGLDLVDQVLLVMAPELASVRAVSLALDTFSILEYPPEMVRLLLNWTFERQGLAQKDIETSLRRRIDLVIPYAPQHFIPAINLGVPPVFDDPLSDIGALFEDMAFAVSKEAHQKAKPKDPSAAWERVVKRLQQRRKTHA
ncbi:MAG: response regulator [Chloroflexi bacterium]|nr:MAG: response regulator [Chloroflexota bacterium]MBL1194394.1 response regulator [Chloroflexota bacterium]NOH11682.1 response regulator [Chloroflexota bacterium]